MSATLLREKPSFLYVCLAMSVCLSKYIEVFLSQPPNSFHVREGGVALRALEQFFSFVRLLQWNDMHRFLLKK